MESITDQSRTIPIEDLSKRHRKQSDPFFMHKARINTGMDMDSRRSSLKSTSDTAQSDLSISDNDFGNQSNSLFKSVRFHLNEGDSYTDSGVATESSTPYHSGSLHDLERRASAPEIKKVQFSPRRGSAPECYHNPRVADEGIHEVDSKESLKDATEDKEMEHERRVEGNVPTDVIQTLESSDSAMKSTHEDDILDSDQQPEQGKIPRVSEIASSFTTNGESEERKFISSTANESLKQVDQLRLHYKEQTVPSAEEQSKSEPVQSTKDEIKAPRDKVSEIRLKFQRTGPGDEHTDSTSKIRTRPISKLVSDRTHKLMNQDKRDETRATDHFGSERVNYRNSTKTLKSSDDIPLFMAPVGLIPWQPKFLSDKRQPQVEPISKPDTLNDSDSDSSSDDEMVEPISPVKGFARMAPFGRGFSSKQPHTNFMTSPLAKQPRTEVPSSSYLHARKKSTAAGRLSSIPEESPTSLLRSSS